MVRRRVSRREALAKAQSPRRLFLTIPGEHGQIGRRIELGGNVGNDRTTKRALIRDMNERAGGGNR